MALIKGRVINLYYTTKGGKLLLHWILRGDEGKIHVTTPTFHLPYCFVDAQYIDEVREVADEAGYPIKIQRAENSRFMQQKAAIPYKITAKFPKHIGNLNKLLEKRNIKLHEADVLYSWRVMIDSGIKGYVSIDPNTRIYKPYEPSTQEMDKWKLRIGYWDIETTYHKRVDPKHMKIVSIAVNNKFFCDDREENIIMDALRYMDQFDVLIDWNGKFFDRRVIEGRLRELGLRFNTKTMQFIDFMQTFIYLHREVSGKYFSLDEAGERFADIKKVYIQHRPEWYYDNDRETLKQYNVRDNHIMMKLNDIFKFSDVYDYMSQEAGVLMSDMFFVSRIPLLLYLRASYSRHERIIVPCAPKFMGKDSTYTGGKVFETVMGIHTDVFGMDLAASYVNIIRTFNCSPEMWNEETGKFDQHEDGIVRLEIMRLQKLRKIYKDQRPKDQNDSMYNVFDILQYAVKVMALTFYGELGRGPSKKSPQGSRLYIRNAAEFITLKGRELIEEAARIVYNNYNAPLIYGDTDSIYIKIPSPLDSAGKSFISGLISNIVHDINRGYAELLTREGINIDHQTVEMEVQGYYPRFYLTAAKKKYIYYLAYDGNVWYDPWKFGYTGMDFKRRETVPFIGKLQKKVCRMVLDLKDIDYIGRFIYSYRKRLFSGKMNKHLIFTYNLTKDLDDYKANTMYVRAARKARDLGVQELKYISYVVTDIKKNKKTVVPILNTEIPKMTYDAYSYYWGRLISTMQNTLEPLIDPMKLEAKLLGRGVLFETL